MAHPQIQAIRELLAASGFDAETIEERRAALDASAGALPAPEGLDIEAATLGGRPVEWLVPTGGRRERVLLYLHGGGYCIGSIATHRGLAGRLALAAQTAVAVLEYRLAPAEPYPAAVEDAVAAYVELLDGGLRPGAVAIGGDSAGGGLTIATLVALGQRGIPQPAAGICLSPWVDLTQSSPSYQAKAGLDPMLTKAGLDQYAEAYLAGTPATDPLASPVHAPLEGLPPLLIEVGEDELLLDDAVTLEAKARVDGVTVDVRIWPHMIHVFQAFPEELLPESGESIRRIADFLSRHLT